ncbi:MAG TPA: Ig-like domain-containing protein [Gemmatimonadales bacterium]|nr:Ig-like domain-containing protein [Gemmatimonadales bacterium]
MEVRQSVSRRPALLVGTAGWITMGVMACMDSPTAPRDGDAPAIPAELSLSLVGASAGTRVEVVNGTVNVRSEPKLRSKLLGSQNVGAFGIVIGGPITDTKGDKLVRWNVDFDQGADGWAAAYYLAAAPSSRFTYGSRVQVANGSVNVRSEPALSAAMLGWQPVGALGTVTGGSVLDSAGDGLIRWKVDFDAGPDGWAAEYYLVGAGSQAPVPVASVTVTPSAASLMVGDSVQLTAVTTDGDGNALADRSVTWSSRDTSRTNVTSWGLVKAMASGVAVILATSEGKTDSAVVTVSSPVRAGHYVAPDGSSGNDGSIARPWSLSYALGGAGGGIAPGDTVWLRGGTYQGAFRSTLAGTSGRPIVVRQYPGERAIIDVAGHTSSSSRGDAFVVSGPWTYWWGLELMSSDPNRYTSTRPNMIVNNASNTKYIHVVVHDGGIGFYNYPSQSNVEITGGIFYNNGWQGSSQGGGHGLYLKSNTGPVVARDNVMFNQFGYGVQVYSDYGGGKLRGITLEGNTAFNNSSVTTQYATSGNANLLVGGQEPAENSVVTNNMTYFSPGVGVYNVVMGSSNYTNGDMQYRDNYVVGGSYALNVGFWNTATVTGNMVTGPGVVARLKDTSLGGYSWGLNLYWRTPTASAWQYNGANYTLAMWRSQTGLGGTDQALASTPLIPRVFVRPSAYEPGRATITVYNWGRAGSVPVALTGVLALGDGFEVRNVQALFAAPVVSGTFDGSITLPMSGVAPPAVVGGAPHAPPRTGPDFDVFVVTKK